MRETGRDGTSAPAGGAGAGGRAGTGTGEERSRVPGRARASSQQPFTHCRPTVRHRAAENPPTLLCFLGNPGKCARIRLIIRRPVGARQILDRSVLRPARYQRAAVTGRRILSASGIRMPCCLLPVACCRRLPPFPCCRLSRPPRVPRVPDRRGSGAAGRRGVRGAAGIGAVRRPATPGRASPTRSPRPRVQPRRSCPAASVSPLRTASRLVSSPRSRGTVAHRAMRSRQERPGRGMETPARPTSTPWRLVA